MNMINGLPVTYRVFLCIISGKDTVWRSSDKLYVRYGAREIMYLLLLPSDGIINVSQRWMDGAKLKSWYPKCRGGLRSSFNKRDTSAGRHRLPMMMMMMV